MDEVKEDKGSWCNRSIIVANFYFCLCITKEAFEWELDDLGIDRRPWVMPNAYATTHLLTSPSKKRYAIVCLQVSPDMSAIDIASLLVHEATHIWQEYCNHIGENAPSEEFEAYSMQHLSYELFKAYIDQTHKENKNRALRNRVSKLKVKAA